MDKVEAKVGFSIKKNLKEDPLIMDRETQIKAILKTFEDSQKLIEKHYSKPNVYPVEVLPVYPDFEASNFSVIFIVLLLLTCFHFCVINFFCSAGNTPVHKLFLTLIQLLWDDQCQLKSKKCHRL